MIVKYITLVSKHIEEDSHLLTSSLGYAFKSEIDLCKGVTGRLFRLNEHSVDLILVPDDLHLKGRNLIVLSTDNCLKEYHEIKRTGVNFNTAPYYIASGMLAEFEDTSGNLFILLEEREYEEN